MLPDLIFAQFGCGYWGPNLLRNFSALPGCRVKYVVDLSAERRAFVEDNFPLSHAIERHEIVLEDPERGWRGDCDTRRKPLFPRQASPRCRQTRLRRETARDEGRRSR